MEFRVVLWSWLALASFAYPVFVCSRPTWKWSSLLLLFFYFEECEGYQVCMFSKNNQWMLRLPYLRCKKKPGGFSSMSLLLSRWHPDFIPLDMAAIPMFPPTTPYMRSSHYTYNVLISVHQVYQLILSSTLLHWPALLLIYKLLPQG